MKQNNKTKEEKIFAIETKKLFDSENEEKIIAKLNKLKSSGKVSMLPLILDLLDQSKSDKVKQEVILFISNLKDQKSVTAIVNYIQKNNHKSGIARIISSCWQSGLDYSNDLNTFIKSFISGDYQVALESFTVIEEMLWKADSNSIKLCKKTLINGISKISPEKKSLYSELIKVLDEGKSGSLEEYSDLID